MESHPPLSLRDGRAKGCYGAAPRHKPNVQSPDTKILRQTLTEALPCCKPHPTKASRSLRSHALSLTHLGFLQAPPDIITPSCLLISSPAPAWGHHSLTSCLRAFAHAIPFAWNTLSTKIPTARSTMLLSSVRQWPHKGSPPNHHIRTGRSPPAPLSTLFPRLLSSLRLSSSPGPAQTYWATCLWCMCPGD